MSARNVLRRWVLGLKAAEKLDIASGDALKLLPATDDAGKLQVGDGTNDMDFQVFLGTTSDYVLFDVGNKKTTYGGAAVLDVPAGQLQIGSTAITATAAEINRNADASGRLVAAGATLTLTEASHEGKTICFDTAAGSVITLPASTGGGAVYRFLVTVTATSGSHVIKVANATDEMRGYVVQDSDTATAPNIWWAADNDDTITLNRTTTGLAAQGEYFEIVDAVLNHFFVRGYSQASGSEATPFSATV